MISGRQCIAARGWLGWSQSVLVKGSGVYRQKVVQLEKGNTIDTQSQLNIEKALVRAGVRILKNGSIILEP